MILSSKFFFIVTWQRRKGSSGKSRGALGCVSSIYSMIGIYTTMNHSSLVKFSYRLHQFFPVDNKNLHDHTTNFRIRSINVLTGTSAFGLSFLWSSVNYSMAKKWNFLERMNNILFRLWEDWPVWLNTRCFSNSKLMRRRNTIWISSYRYLLTNSYSIRTWTAKVWIQNCLQIQKISFLTIESFIYFICRTGHFWQNLKQDEKPK